MDLVDVNGKWKMGLNGKKEVNYTKVVVISLELIVLVKVTLTVFRAEFGFFHFEEHFLKSTCQVIIPGYVCVRSWYENFICAEGHTFGQWFPALLPFLSV